MRRFLLLLCVCTLAGCVPYAVGMTPDTVPERQVSPSAVVQIASGRRALDVDDSPDKDGRAAFVIGNEARVGLDERSDVGVRLLGLGSVTATYKRRLTGQVGTDEGSALIVGAGVIGLSHFHLEATVVTAYPVEGPVVPYGGVRVQHLVPFTEEALSPVPAVGAFGGARFGWSDLSLSPELGVFYSPSPTGRDSDIIYAPSITIRGDRLMRALGL
ncbi:MAG: hypothetical protein AAF170_12215 [Bacteroidota bacterium]